MTTGADILVRCLFERGVRHIFGMPGSHSAAIYDAIARDGRIQTILIRNEQAGAYAADGYARVTGRPGVVCTTAGPGATNALSGIGEAWADSMPVLLIAGQVHHDRIHQERGEFHEIDLESIFRPCTNYSMTLRDNGQIPRLVEHAFRAMTKARPRPAALFFPRDLMAAPATYEPAPSAAPLTFTPLPDSLEQAYRWLLAAKRPILLAGGGAVWSDAGPELHALAQRLDCPLITTLNGKGILDERNPYCLGHARSARAQAALPHADVMLAVGCRFTEVFTGFRRLKIPPTLLQIDIDAAQIGVNYFANVAMCGDAKPLLQKILEGMPALERDGWRNLWPTARATVPANPEWLIEKLRAGMPEDGIVFTDASEMAYRMHTDYPAYAPRTFFYPSNYIALGWGYPAAIGAAVALPNRAIACVSGDGGFVMTHQELATAARYRLPVIAIVHNDNAYGAIKHLQRHKHGERYVDTDLNNPDFLKLAEAFCVPAARAATPDLFELELRRALDRAGPSLIEVPDAWRFMRQTG